MLFENISGHSEEIKRLKKALEEGKIPQTLLFWGPRGVGKFMVAHRFAKMALCRESPDASADCACSSCKKAEKKEHPDLKFVEPNEKNNIGIGEIRKLESQILLKPFESKYQFAIIRDAHRMNFDAQNSFLKLLEEPPPYAHFILITDEPSGLLPTVVSRCQKIRFSPLTDEEILRHLIKTKGLSEEEASKLSTLLGGSLERAEESDSIKLIEEARIKAFELLNHSHSGEIYKIDDLAALVKKEQLLMLDELLRYFRGMMIALTGKTFDKTLSSDEEWEAIGRASKHFTFDRTCDALFACAEAKESIEQAMNPKIIFAKLYDDLGIKIRK